MSASSQIFAIDGAAEPAQGVLRPFAAFAAEVRSHDGRRAAIDAAYRAPETECLPGLLRAAELPAPVASQARALARSLIEGLRARPATGLVQGLMHEYDLSSQEGVALMCLAEALLRIPDAATRDALIADKIGGGEWRAHVGRSPSPFVNAATWGLLITGQLIGSVDEVGLAATLTRLIARSGAPIIRASVDTAMRVFGEQFVCGQTIEAALANARALEARGYRYSYDMLGEAAATAEDAERYLASYEAALRAIGAASAGRGIYEGPGLSIKLSALHPRYARSQRRRVMDELYPRLKRAGRARARARRRHQHRRRRNPSGSTFRSISWRACAATPNSRAGTASASSSRPIRSAPTPTLGWIIELARATKRRIMLRLVKGAYWDSEIKRTQVEGLEGFAVFTRKIHTDVSYIACARQLLEAPDAIFPQFATHNALTLATVHAMAGKNFYAGQYEFQCLHGMGEPLYNQIVGRGGDNRPCRVYAPVGSHETLLAYLVRRLLENGANTSFVNRIADASVPVDELIEDPVEAARALVPVGAPHPKIVLPRDLFAPERANSAGLDLSNEARLGRARPSAGAKRESRLARRAPAAPRRARFVNPADPRDVVGHVADADAARSTPRSRAPRKAGRPGARSSRRARANPRRRRPRGSRPKRQRLAGLICREAGKTLPNALGDVREAVDFLRYYAARMSSDFANATHRPLGVVVCISPWNFPDRDFHRPDRRRARRRQCRHRQAGGGNAADRRRSGAR